MEHLRSVTGIAVPLRRSDVDTDQIIPSRFMKRITKHGYEDGLFDAWRADPGFVLNQPRYLNPTILVAGGGFGSGSSREHAVWALHDYGFHAVIAPSFADIFRGNATKQGLLAAVIEERELDSLWKTVEDAPHQQGAVDLSTRRLTLADHVWELEFDNDTQRRLMEGVDDFDLTLRDPETISAFEAQRPSWLPRTLSIPDISLHPQ